MVNYKKLLVPLAIASVFSGGLLYIVLTQFPEDLIDKAVKIHTRVTDHPSYAFDGHDNCIDINPNVEDNDENHTRHFTSGSNVMLDNSGDTEGSPITPIC